jgi:hypothetical protein
MERVTVERLKVDCTVARDHPNAHAVRTRLDDAGARLPSALAQLLAPLAKLGDQVIIIRKLELDFELDTSLDASDLARAWAAKIAAGVAAALRPDSRATMLQFADDAHYLARFLSDSVAGHATQRWYYKRWSGLAPLSLAARLRTALIEDPRRGMAALAALSRSELIAVTAALGSSEARRVVEAMIAAPGEDDLEAAARVVIPLVPAWLLLAPAVQSAWQAALALAAPAFDLAPGELRSIVALAGALATMARREGSTTTTRSIAAMLDGAGMPSVERLLALTPPTRQAVLATLGTTVETVERAMPPAGWYTRLGGLLLLLPRIAELRLDEVFGADAGRARLGVLSRAAGRDRRDVVLADPLWRRMCGVAGDVDVDAWLAQPYVAEALSAAMWRRGLARSQHLRLVATRHAQPMLVVSSEPDGVWMSLAPLTRELRDAIRDTDAIEIEGMALTVNVAHATARGAAHVLAWSAPHHAFDHDLPLTIAAQHVLRAFARRLPGFGESSPRFLYDSFLDFDATVMESDGTFHCRVGRPRLAALFGLTGALRGRLPIDDGRALELYPEG